MMEKHDEPRMRFIQSRLPTGLYEWLRLRAFLLRQSMNSIVLESVAAYRTAVNAGQITPSKETGAEHDTVVKYNVRVDEDLYEWLRTTAFYARVSINTLLISALVRFRAAHEDDTPGTITPPAS
jgi:hypothetical protein